MYLDVSKCTEMYRKVSKCNFLQCCPNQSRDRFMKTNGQINQCWFVKKGQKGQKNVFQNSKLATLTFKRSFTFSSASEDPTKPNEGQKAQPDFFILARPEKGCLIRPLPCHLPIHEKKDRLLTHQRNSVVISAHCHCLVIRTDSSCVNNSNHLLCLILCTVNHRSIYYFQLTNYNYFFCHIS